MSDEICSICLKFINNKVGTLCEHFFCEELIVIRLSQKNFFLINKEECLILFIIKFLIKI